MEELRAIKEGRKEREEEEKKKDRKKRRQYVMHMCWRWMVHDA